MAESGSYKVPESDTEVDTNAQLQLDMDDMKSQMNILTDLIQGLVSRQNNDTQATQATNKKPTKATEAGPSTRTTTTKDNDDSEADVMEIDQPSTPIKYKGKEPIYTTPPTTTITNQISDGAIKELAKTANRFKESQKLKSPYNFDQWKQALTIQLRAFKIANFINDPSIARHFNESEQALLLLMLKNSYSEEAAEAIDWCNDPEEAYLLLVA